MAEHDGQVPMSMRVRLMLSIVAVLTLTCWWVTGNAVWDVLNELAQTTAAVLVLSTTGGSQ